MKSQCQGLQTHCAELEGLAHEPDGDRWGMSIARVLQEKRGSCCFMASHSLSHRGRHRLACRQRYLVSGQHNITFSAIHHIRKLGPTKMIHQDDSQSWHVASPWGQECENPQAEALEAWTLEQTGAKACVYLRQPSVPKACQHFRSQHPKKQRVDLHLAHQPVYKSHAGSRSIVDLPDFPEMEAESITHGGPGLANRPDGEIEIGGFLGMMRWGQCLKGYLRAEHLAGMKRVYDGLCVCFASCAFFPPHN